ncbi:ATP-NAD kinase-like domain-containing protein, partial [Lactifluus volemus]
GKPKSHVPLSHVLWVSKSGPVIEVHVLRKTSWGLKLAILSGSFHGDDSSSAADDWVRGAMNAAYQGVCVKTQRRLLVVINPHGGSGRAMSLFKHKVEPILDAARCAYKVVRTEYSGHALKIASEISPDEIDAVVSVSGDGILHELINGFAQHKEPLKAFRIPIAPIPAGSGNGTCLNLVGVKDGQDVAAAALNVIKGRPMSIDVLSILQSGKRSLSFMSQCVGLMADLDLGTEHLRWMGSNRFVYGYLRGLLTRKAYRFSISVKTGVADKSAMIEALREYTSSAPHYEAPPREELPENTTALPPLLYANDTEGWTTFEGPILYLYAGKGPYVSRDLMQFPVSVPNDGMVDLVIQGRLSRTEMWYSLDGAEKGATFWQNNAHYLKTSAYRVRPLQEEGNLAIDGERFPFGEYYAEVHRGLATALSMSGRYAVDVDLQPLKSV